MIIIPDNRKNTILEKKDLKSIWDHGDQKRMLLYLRNKTTDLMEHIRADIEAGIRTNKNNFFVDMAKFVGTKNIKQCKSRYQKKEKVLLKAIGMSHELVDAYFNIKRTKSMNSSFKNKESMTTTIDTSSSMLRSEELTITSIDSFIDLKSVLVQICLPKVNSEAVKIRLESFISDIPVGDGLIRELSTCYLNTLEQGHSHVTIVPETIKTRKISPFLTLD